MDTPTTLTILVDGEPVGKERPRFPKITPNMVGKVVRPYTAPKTRAYEKRVATIAMAEVKRQRWAWSDNDRFHVVVKVFRTHVDAGPDVDNVQKIVLDALNGITWKDDRYVWGQASALQPRDRKNPRVEIIIKRINKNVLLQEGRKA